MESYTKSNGNSESYSYIIAHGHSFANAFTKRHQLAYSHTQSFAHTGIPDLGMGIERIRAIWHRNNRSWTSGASC